MAVLHYVLPLAFAALLILAAVSDLLTMTIPNRLSLAMAALFPVAALVAGFDITSIGWHAFAGAGVLTVCFAMFAFGWIGGGDAKLAAAIALWIGPSLALLEWAVVSALFGGALTLALLAGRQFPLPMALAGQSWIARLHDRHTGVPYGIALAAAALIIYPATPLFLRLAA